MKVRIKRRWDLSPFPLKNGWRWLPVSEPTRVVWISRHTIGAKNIMMLQEAFGERLVITQITKTIRPEDVPKIIEQHGTTSKYVVVLPPDIIQEFIEHGAEVYRFTVERHVTENGDVEVEPIGLERIKEIKYVTEKVV